MNIKTFIDRPVLSFVISITLVLIGVIGIVTLPVEQYPDIAPPTVQVSTAYPGASAETLLKSVIAPLEEAINGVENMTYITSTTSNNGNASINVYFKQGTDPDMAAVNVQNRVSKATGSLPAEVNRIGVTTSKRQTSMLKVFSLRSTDDRYDENFLSNYVNINLRPEILRISGVGDVMVLGGDYSMRIWLKPDIMAQYKLTPSDINKALAEQNIESPTGALAENTDQTFQYAMKYKGRLSTPEEFENIVIRSTEDGNILKLKDVATIELGKESYGFIGEANGRPGIATMVYQTAGSNATEVVENIDTFLAQAEKNLPPGIEIIHLTSVNDFLYASMDAVIKTLIEAIILVILVVYVFLQDIRSTIVPTVAIIVSLVGTFAFLSIAGFSINLLTLFALVLAIGTVVDDAIVVVEAVQERFDAGYRSAYKATIDAMSNITSAIVTTTIVFMAVFIPVTFMGGTAGTFYTQFGITMAVAVGISTINALTLSPALCALILKPYLDENGQPKDNFAARFRKAFTAVFDVLSERYKNIVVFFVKRKWLAGVSIIGACIVLVLLVNSTKTGLVPDEDQGTIFVNVSTAPGTSLSQTETVLKQVEARISQIPQISNYQKVSGFGLLSGQGSSFGTFIIKLKHWDERPEQTDHVKAVIGQIYGRTQDIKDASIFAIAPGMIPGYGVGNGFELHLQNRGDADLATFQQTTQEFLGKLRQRPEVASVYSTFNINYPQWEVEVDAAKCKRAGIGPDEVLATLSAYCGGNYVSNINRFSKIYRVMIQAAPEYRLDEKSLQNLFVRVGNNMAPISEFASLKRVYGAETLTRFNMFSSISSNGTAAQGYSSGDAINAVRETAEEFLPRGYSFDFGGISREESQGGSNTVIIIGICIVLIYLILSALYESFMVPFAVILSIPFGLMGSFLFAKMMGIENNIYLQTGLIMLIGLLAKTAILLTEYAGQRRAAGMSISAAAVEAAKVRLRPILMTSLTMIFGLFPLMIATGVGANGNRSLGTSTIGGMFIGTLALLFIVPTLFIVFQTLQEKIKPLHFSKVKDQQIEHEKQRYAEEKMKRASNEEGSNNDVSNKE